MTDPEKPLTTADSQLDDLLATRPGKSGKKKKNKSGSARGVETMFRNLYRLHTDLFSLADQKANLLMTINGVVMAVVIGTNGIAITSDKILIIPTIIVLISAVLSMIFAVLAARPRMNTMPLSLEEARSQPGNLLFFGNFVSMKPEEFTEAMMELVAENERVYPAMARNIHSLGLVLRQKFDRLRVAYMMILFGLPVGVTSFIAIHLWRALSPA